MKYMIGIFVACSLLAGCDAEYKDKSRSYQMPPGMEHCKVYRLEGEGGNRNLTAVVCKNSTTSVNYSEGKTDYSVVTEDQ